MSRRAIATAASVAAASIGVGWMLSLGSGSQTVVFLLLVGIFAVATLGTLWFCHSRLGDLFSPLGLTSAFWFLVGVAGATLYYFEPSRPFSFLVTRADMTWAVAVSLSAYVLLVVGYLANPFGVLMHVVPPFRSRSVTLSPSAAVILLLAVGWLARAERVRAGRYFHTQAAGEIVSTGSSWLIAALSTLPLIAVALLAARAIRGRTPRAVAAAGLMLLAEVAWQVPTGERGALIALGLALIAVRYYTQPREQRRLPWKPVIAISLVLVFVVFPLIREYRGDNRQYQRAPLANLASAVDSFVHQTPAEFLVNGLESSLSRFSASTSIAVIRAREQDPLGIAPGESVRWASEVFLPRAVVPGKHDPGLFGNEFGRAYSIIHPSDRITSVAVTQVSEAYLSLGMLGIVIFFPVIGGVYRLLGDFMQRRGDDDVALSIYAVLIWALIKGNENIVALGLTGVAKQLLLYLILVSAAGSIYARTGRPNKARLSPTIGESA